MKIYLNMLKTKLAAAFIIGSLLVPAKGALVITNFQIAGEIITFDIAGSIDAGANIGPNNPFRLYVGVPGDTDWVNVSSAIGSVTNNAGATVDLDERRYTVGGGILVIAFGSTQWATFPWHRAILSMPP